MNRVARPTDSKERRSGKKVKCLSVFLSPSQVPTLNQQIIPTNYEKEIEKILQESEPILRMARMNSGYNEKIETNDSAYKHFGESVLKL